MSRRSIIILVLALAVGGPLVLGGIAILAGGGDDLRQIGAINVGRTYAAGHFLLTTDGANSQTLGYLKSYEGCRAKGGVAHDAPNANGVIRKNISGLSTEACVLRFSPNMEPAFWSMVADMVNGTGSPRDLRLRSGSFDQNVLRDLRLTNAVPSKFVIPQFDASSKDSVTFELTLQTDSIVPLAIPAGAKLPSKTGGAKSSPNAGLANYRFEVAPPGTTNQITTTRVNKVGPIEVRRPANGGKGPDVQISDLDVAMSASDGAAVHGWFNDFVVQGNNNASNEATASLVLQNHSRTTELMRFDFSGVGIFDVSDQTPVNDSIARTLFSLYAEQMTLAIPGGFGQATPPPASTPPPSETSTEAMTTKTPPPPPPPAETTREEPTETTPEEERFRIAAPGKVSGVIVGDREVQLTWSPVEGAEGYVILASTEPKDPESYFEVAESKETEIIVADLRPGTYFFVVRARAGESQSVNSEPAEVVVD